MENSGILIAFVLLLCTALSFLLSGMETGVLGLSRLRVLYQKRAGNPRARILHGFLENPENFLWTILVGNTVTNTAVFTLGALVLYGWLGDRPLLWLLAFGVAVFFFYVLCELLPKMLFQRFPNRLCLLLAGPFRFVHLTLAPLVAVVAWFSRWLLRWTGGRKFTGRLFGNRDELRFVMQESGHGLTTEERAMINRVLDLQNFTVRVVTIPMSRVVSVTTNTSISEVFILARQTNFTRFPVFQRAGARDRIVGVLSLKRLLYRDDLDPRKTAGAYLHPALYVQEDLPLEEASRRMQRSGRRLAIVLDHEQHEVGIISLQDILKVIFGEVNL
jgi:putative hemolysin